MSGATTAHTRCPPRACHRWAERAQMWVSGDVAFKLTYTDGQESDYDDGTKWKVEDGVLKLAARTGNGVVFVSPGHWATIEVAKTRETRKRRRTTSRRGDERTSKDEETRTTD